MHKNDFLKHPFHGLFRNIRDGPQLSALGKQMFLGNNKALVEAYEDATLCKMVTW